MFTPISNVLKIGAKILDSPALSTKMGQSQKSIWKKKGVCVFWEKAEKDLPRDFPLKGTYESLLPMDDGCPAQTGPSC